MPHPFFAHIAQTPAVPFHSLPLGGQFTSPCGGVIYTKISRSLCAFANDHSGKVITSKKTWNTKVIPISEAQAIAFSKA